MLTVKVIYINLHQDITIQKLVSPEYRKKSSSALYRIVELKHFFQVQTLFWNFLVGNERNKNKD
jgi:hypothetical protein